ncbi:MAG: hypothetical protein M1837_000637 [Sclerophora amabilis]|nr:MAG: hypothetical protein M1837_000637 [Sclerophora amabilis]
MLPLGLLNAAQGHPMLVELKNGETLNGHLVNCDTWMNLTLKEVVQTSPIKYLRVPDEIIDLVKEAQQQSHQQGVYLQQQVVFQIRRGRKPWLRRQFNHGRTFKSTFSNFSNLQTEKNSTVLDPYMREWLKSVYRTNSSSAKNEDESQSLEHTYKILGLAASRHEYTKVEELVTYLVESEHEKPNLRLYSALILANADANSGSAGAVALLLDELRRERINLNSETYHYILKVLAVHPDYVFRNEILLEMQQRWFNLNPEGSCNVAVGLLREQNIELAMEKLAHMIQDNMSIPEWLYDAFIYVLLEMEEIDEAMKIIRHRDMNTNGSISAIVWYQLLENASSAFHLEATNYAWRKRVEPNHMLPPDGICVNVLNTAARHGDRDLATDVFRILGNRSFDFDAAHYEALIEAYAKSEDLIAALTVLCIMNDAGVRPEEASTRAILHTLQQHSDNPPKAFGSLRKLNREHHRVPSVALNCIIEATVSFGDLERAIEQYKHFHSICPDGPNTHTFNSLISGCNHSGRKDLAMFLAAEMVALKLQPNRLTYDRLILVCLAKGDTPEDYEDAFRYLDEMKGRDFIPRRGTYLALIQKCLRAGDNRADMLLKDMQANGMDITGTQLSAAEFAASNPSNTNHIGEKEDPVV